MITENFVSFETAKLLKEKGFEAYTLMVYKLPSQLLHIDKEYLVGNNNCITKGDSIEILAPTHQMAMKWLREKHNKHCDIGYDIDLEWYFQIINLKETVEYDYPEPKYYHSENETNFKTYEEAVEAALKYVLVNLI